VICSDTSFLFALYGSDVHTPKAIAEVRRMQIPITIFLLNEYELLNAIHFAVFRRLLTTAQARLMAAAFDADLAAGCLLLLRSNMASIVIEARRLSSTYTQTHGNRSFDILHVAAAIRVGATEFLTFDSNQRILAEAEGLKVRPGL
jgi:predicted nucleic acid-binding protein